MYLPEGDKYSMNRVAIESQLCSLYGGRVAEELIFGADKVTTGASNDIERATKMARNMVTKWGLSDELGPIAYGEEDDEVRGVGHLGLIPGYRADLLAQLWIAHEHKAVVLHVKR